MNLGYYFDLEIEGAVLLKGNQVVECQLPRLKPTSHQFISLIESHVDCLPCLVLPNFNDLLFLK